MINPDHRLPVTRQANVLGLSRSSVYYRPVPLSDSDLELMRQIDAQHLECPFAGSRMLKSLLALDGVVVGRRHVSTLMKRMGIEAIYRKPRTTHRHPGHAVHPYRLRGMTIDRPNQVWAMDITYIPMKKGFVYFAAVMDWYSRRILSWRLSNTLTPDFCVEALESAMATHGTPDIVNTDQGSQFTSAEFVAQVEDNGALLSMDGKGAWRDNVFIERFWRTLKYENVYLHAYADMADARQHLTTYISFYNGRRPHSSLEDRTPDTVFYNQQQKAA